MDPLPFGLSFPTTPLQGQPEGAEMLMRQPIARRPAAPSWDSVVGTGVPVYPEGTRNSRFHQMPSDTPTPKIETVVPFSMSGAEPMSPEPQKFSRGFKAPTAPAKFVKQRKGGLGEFETIDPASMMSPEASDSAKLDLHLTLKDRLSDLLKSTASGFGTGMADLMALPRTAAEIPNRFTGQEIIPDRIIEMMPDSAQYKAMGEKVTGPWYEPKTDAGRYFNIGGQFLPMVLGGTLGGAVKGGMEAGAMGAVKGAARGTKLTTPFAVMPLYSGGGW